MSARDLYLTDEQHIASVRRMRERIAAGAEHVASDSNARGAKRTAASWGMCTDEPGFWEREEQLFPDREPIYIGSRRGPGGGLVDVYTVTSKYHDVGQFCPHDRRGRRLDADTQRPAGCFYHCDIFRPTNGKLTREGALRNFDVALERLSRWKGDGGQTKP